MDNNIQLFRQFLSNQFKGGGKKNKGHSRPSYNEQTFLQDYNTAWKGTRYDTPEWRAFWTKLAKRESSFNPQVMNSIGAKGYFQLMPFNRSSNWQNNTQQFAEADKLIRSMEAKITADDLRRAEALGLNKQALLAGAWLGGIGGMRAALRGNTRADKNGTTVMSRMKDFNNLVAEQPQVDPVEQYLNTPIGTHIIDNPIYATGDQYSSQAPITAKVGSNTPVQEVEPFVTYLPEVVVTAPSPQRKAIAQQLLNYGIQNQPQIASILVQDNDIPTITDKVVALSQADTNKRAQDINDAIIRQNIEQNFANSQFTHFFNEDQAAKQRNQIQDPGFLRAMSNTAAYGGNISSNMFKTGGPFSWGMPTIPRLILAQKLKKLSSSEPQKKPQRDVRIDRKQDNQSQTTARRSQAMENQIYSMLPKQRTPYDIQFIPDKQILINDYNTSTNALDSLAKYAGIHNRTLQVSEMPIRAKSKTKTRPITKEEALGLSLRETKGGALPYTNDSRTSGDKEAKRAFYNANVFTAFQDIPATALVNDYHYNKTSQTMPPLLDAFQYYAQGDYNRLDSNHTADVKAAGKEAFKNPQVQRWWNNEGKYWFNGTYQNAGDDGGEHSMLQGELLNIGTQPVKLKANGGNLFYDGGNTEDTTLYGGTLPEVTVWAKASKIKSFADLHKRLQNQRTNAFDAYMHGEISRTDYDNFINGITNIEQTYYNGNIRKATAAAGKYLAPLVLAPILPIAATSASGLALLAPGTPGGTIMADMALGALGAKVVDDTTQKITGDTWNNNISNLFSQIPGTDKAPQWLKDIGNNAADFTNPGWYLGVASKPIQKGLESVWNTTKQGFNQANRKYVQPYRLSRAINQGVEENGIITGYNRNPRNLDTGSLQDYQSYLDEIFPNSKIKDVQWHGGRPGIERFKSPQSEGYIGEHSGLFGNSTGQEGIYVSPDKDIATRLRPRGKSEIYPVLINAENPYVSNQWLSYPFNREGFTASHIRTKDLQGPLRGYDSLDHLGENAVWNPRQTLILGSNEDAIGFSNWVYRNQKPNNLFNRFKFGDVEINNPNLFYRQDNPSSGAFDHANSYVENGILIPGQSSMEGQANYSWWNKGKPYLNISYPEHPIGGINGIEMPRLFTAGESDAPFIRVKSQSYPIGQWNGKRGFVQQSEYVSPEAIDVSNSTYMYEPNYGYKKVTSEPSTIDFNTARTTQKQSDFASELDWQNWLSTRPNSNTTITQEEINALNSRIPEYLQIEQQAKSNGTWLKMPDGSTWQGDPRSWVQMQSKDFQKAFSNIAKDENGNSLVLTHGTPNRFNEFDENMFGTSTDPGDKGVGIYANAPNTYSSKLYGDYQIPLVVNSENPLSTYNYLQQRFGPEISQVNADARKSIANGFMRNFHRKLFGKRLQQNPERLQQVLNDYPQFLDNDLLIADDYNPGIISDAYEVVIPFSNPVKSLLGNTGEFNLSNKNIYRGLFPIGIGLGLYNQQALGGSLFNSRTPIESFQGGKQLPTVRY